MDLLRLWYGMNLHGASPLRSEIDIVEGLHLIVAEACMEYNAFYQDGM